MNKRKMMVHGIKDQVLIEILKALYDLPRSSLDSVIEAAIEVHEEGIEDERVWVDIASDLDKVFGEIGSAGPFGTGEDYDV